MEQEMDDLASASRVRRVMRWTDAGDKASGFGSKISSGFTVLKGIAANVIASGIQAIASSLTSLAGEAVDAADSLTKFESTMSFAGFSTRRNQRGFCGDAGIRKPHGIRPPNRS